MAALSKLLVSLFFWLHRIGIFRRRQTHPCAICDVETPFLPFDINCCVDCKSPLCATDYNPDNARCLNCQYGWWGVDK